MPIFLGKKDKKLQAVNLKKITKKYEKENV